jgi:predicted AlkP superfamily pyrophosphatase or phosphodiesterase
MSKALRHCVAAAVALLLAQAAFSTGSQGTHAGGRAQAARPEHVILISVDGMPPDYYTAPEKLGLRVPTLTMLKQGGAHAEGMEGVYPTVTYPQHTTMVTGLRPAAHGIVQNRIFEPPSDPQTRYWYWHADALKAETLWTAARRAGLTTAAVGWPVTVGAGIDYNVPEIYEPGEEPPTWNWTARHSTPGLLEKALGPGLKADRSVDERLTSVSEFIIKNYRPNLLLLHLIELDGVHHRSGPRTKAALATAEREDGYIRRVVEATREAGIFEKTTFFVVSDHGFAAISKRFSPNVALAKEGLITLDAAGKATAWQAAAWPSGGSCAIVLKDANDSGTAKRVEALFTKWARQEHGPIKRVVTRAELRRLQAVPQAALMLEAAPGFSFDETLTGPEVRDSGETYRGTHGYLPSDPRMRASLIIYGPGVRRGAKLPLARMVDLAPSIASLLRLNLPGPEGQPFKGLLSGVKSASR